MKDSVEFWGFYSGLWKHVIERNSDRRKESEGLDTQRLFVRRNKTGEKGKSVSIKERRKCKVYVVLSQV